jgi:hypothetical protein
MTIKYQIADADCGIPINDEVLYSTVNDALWAVLDNVGLMILEVDEDEDGDEDDEDVSQD